MGQHRKKTPLPLRIFRAFAVASAASAMGVAGYGLIGARSPSQQTAPPAALPSTSAPPLPTTAATPTFTLPPRTVTVTTIRPPDPPPTPTVAPKPPPPVIAACIPLKLGGVAPAVGRVAANIQQRFGLPLVDLLGVGERSTPDSDHPKGLAVDFMVGINKPLGDAIAQYALDRQASFGITYVIWQQRINFGNGWQPMEDRGSPTANHQDHIHVSFSPNAPGSVTC